MASRLKRCNDGKYYGGVYCIQDITYYCLLVVLMVGTELLQDKRGESITYVHKPSSCKFIQP